MTGSACLHFCFGTMFKGWHEQHPVTGAWEMCQRIRMLNMVANTIGIGVHKR